MFRPRVAKALASLSIFVAVGLVAAGVAVSHSNEQFFGDGSNTANGHEHQDIFHMAGGDDVANGEGAGDNLYMADDRDVGRGGGGQDVVNGGGGNDKESLGSGTYNFRGIHGNQGEDDLEGNEHDDYVEGGTSTQDRIGGGPDNDRLNGVDDLPNDAVNGGDGGSDFDQCRVDANSNFQPIDDPSNCEEIDIVVTPPG